MHYPSHHLAKARLIFEHPTGGARPRLVYNNSSLNQLSSWGQEVLTKKINTPFGPDVLVFFDHNCVLQLRHYLAALLHPEDPVPLADIQAVETLNATSNASAQLARREARDEAIRACHKRMADGHKAARALHAGCDTLTPEQEESIVQKVMARGHMTRALVLKALGNATKAPAKARSTYRPDDHKTAAPDRGDFARGDWRFRQITARVNEARAGLYIHANRGKNSAAFQPAGRLAFQPKEQPRFSLADLVDPTASGGYPDRCPVFGVPLAWDEPSSYLGVRVWVSPTGAGPRGAPRAALMSKGARTLLNGSASVPTAARIEAVVASHDPDVPPAEALAAWRAGYV